MQRMMNMLIVCVLFLSHMSLHGTTKFGGNGLIHVHSARTVPQGHLRFYGGSHYFGKIANLGSQTQAYTFWSVQGFTSFNLGIGPHAELFLAPVLYQDTNSSGGNILDGMANLPDDLFFGFKLASFGDPESSFRYGGLVHARVPTAAEHNLVYQPYSAGSLEVGLTGLFSYYSNAIFPDDGWSIHGNLGYLNHNDVGKELTDDPLNNDPTPSAMSSELIFGIGTRIPAGTFDFSAEINASYFLNQPPITAYSREYVSFLTLGVYYKPYRWITVEMGLDFRLISEEDQSDYQTTHLSIPPEDFPNYPGWRGLLGVKLAILPFSVYTSSERESLERSISDRREILDRLMKEQEETQDADSELARLRAERQRIEEDLRRLRQLLEAEKAKKEEKKKKKGEEG